MWRTESIFVTRGGHGGLVFQLTGGYRCKAASDLESKASASLGRAVVEELAS